MAERVCVYKRERGEGVDAPDKSFDGDGEEKGFWHERGQSVIMMSLEVYSETDRRRLLYCTIPEGCHYQLKLSRDLSTGQTHRKCSLTPAHTHTGTGVSLFAWIHTCMSVFLCSDAHTISHRQASIT